MTVENLHNRRKSYLLVVTALMLLIAGCSRPEQAQIQTAIVQGKKFAETEAAQLKETAVAVAQTQAAHLKETAVAQLTELANKPPSPWDISWIPADSQVAINNIDAILQGTGLAKQGSIILQYAKEFGVNPAFALAMFRKEASFAQPNTRAYRNNNPGNINATGECKGLPAGSSCSGIYGEIGTDGRFGKYASMADGIKAYFMLMNREYQPGTKRNCKDIACIIPYYCPPSECDTSAYIDLITKWTQEYQSKIISS